MQPPGQTLEPTRRHFDALDGLRGVAALVVVIFHFMEMVIGDYSKLWIGHGWLAVDFFFCLSGFVIGYAYDDRVGKLGIWSFFRLRLIRLHPMVVFGTLLGLLTLYVDPFRHGPMGYAAGKVALAFVLGVLMIPYPLMRERGNSIFSLNSPAWSLFWEYVANIVYALVLVHVNRRWLMVLTVCAGIWLCWTGHAEGHLWAGFNGRTFWVGAARVAFSFSAGLLVYRSGWTIKTKLGFAGLSALFVLAMLMPYTEGGWVREAAVITVYFPLLVILGAGTSMSHPSEAFCRLAGNLSYPLYMSHYAVIWSFGNYYRYAHPDTAHLTIAVVSGVVVMLAFAYLIMIFYDTPIRNSLRKRLKQHASTV